MCSETDNNYIYDIAISNRQSKCEARVQHWDEIVCIYAIIGIIKCHHLDIDLLSVSDLLICFAGVGI